MAKNRTEERIYAVVKNKERDGNPSFILAGSILDAAQRARKIWEDVHSIEFVGNVLDVDSIMRLREKEAIEYEIKLQKSNSEPGF